MKRSYYPYTQWEDFNCGMYANLEKDKEKEAIDRAVELLSNPQELYLLMKRVSLEWVKSTEQNFSDTGSNRRAWLGQAACCIQDKIPEYITRIAWMLLSKDKQDEANDIADRVIYEYENKQWRLRNWI
jgi:hypothetical protein